MIELTDTTDNQKTTSGTLTLTLEQRQRSRLHSHLDDGREVGLFLARGQQLRDGDRLTGPSNETILIRAADEDVSTVVCSDPLLLTRAAYHLGNRHTRLQIGNGWLRYLTDPVLDDLMRLLGLEIRCHQAAFSPEPGAYHPQTAISGHSNKAVRHQHEHG